MLSPKLNQAARDIWQWCEKRRIVVFASYIKSANNWEADLESRRPNPNTEVALSHDAFSFLSSHLGQCEVDAFASRVNHKCDRYWSWFPNPEAEGVDAFTFSWANDLVYLFPPVYLVGRTLRKIRADRVKGILVVP